MFAVSFTVLVCIHLSYSVAVKICYKIDILKTCKVDITNID